MTDIYEKLREHGCNHEHVWVRQICHEAATEIERLRNQKKELLNMVLENLKNEYPEYKMRYERLKKHYITEKEYLTETYDD